MVSVQRHWKLLAVALMLSCTLSDAEQPPVRTIRFRGNHAFTEAQLLRAMTTKPSAFFLPSVLQQDLASVLSLYHRQGFYSAEVRVDSLGYPVDSSAVDVTIGVLEGQRSVIGGTVVEGNTVFTADEIFGAFDSRPGAVLDPQTLEGDLDRLLSRYERVGYPFAKAEISDISPEKDSSGNLRIAITVDEGERVRINEIRVSGNKDTKDAVIIRETRIKPGELFNQERIKAIQGRLNRLNIFSSVSEPELYMNAAGGALLIAVQEGTTNVFDGVIGYVPGTQGGTQGYFTGMADVSMRNLFGTGRKLNARWQREDRSTQEVSVRYVEPWLFDFPLNLGGGFSQRQQDTAYVRRTVDAKADFLLTESLSIGILFAHESVIPSAAVAIQSVLNSSTVTTGIAVQYDSRNDPLSPTTGVNYRSDYQIGTKKISGLPPSSVIKESGTVRKVSLDADGYAETFPRQVVALGLHGRQLTTDYPELGDLYRFGGTNTLRGYRENQFLGSRVAWTNAEYRFLLARRSFFYGFFDTGYYFLPGDDAAGISSIERFKYGYGVGIRLETSLGNIGVSFALGEGDSFAQGKIHVGLVNEF